MMRWAQWHLATVALAGLAIPHHVAGQVPDRAVLRRTIDSIAMEPIRAQRAAGMSIAVVRGADTIAMKGYGYADLEFDVPTPADAIYEIGSVTKQFTAAAVFQLRDKGALSLDDDITRFLPTYPIQGHHVTIRRLLNHTSGIKGYTEMPDFWDKLVARELPPDSLIALFGPQPFDFAPGEAMIYNNSAYFLLGLIIEKASGERYADYVRAHLFEPAGMTNSRFCPDYDVVKRRSHGYDMGQAGLQRTRFLTFVWPFSAGSLCSTARDLVQWNRALHGPNGRGGSVLSPATYREYMTPGTLNDGTRLRYANGLTVVEKNGRRVIAHGGGIFGFLCELRYYPDDDLSLAVLINTAGPVDPGTIADAIESAVLGKAAPRPARVFGGDARALAGTYSGAGRGQTLTATVALDSTGLTVALGTGAAQPLAYVDSLTFRAGVALYRFVRQHDRIVELRADQVGGYYILKRESQ